MAPSAIEHEHTNGTLPHQDTYEDSFEQYDHDEHVAFGGDDQWYYNPKTQRFDLSRGSQRRLAIDADDGIRNHRGVEIDPAKTLLVIIDMQNFFIHPSFHKHDAGIKTLAPLKRVIDQCREKDIDVCWLNWGIDDEELRNMPPAVTRGFNKALCAEKGHGWVVNLGAKLPAHQAKVEGERCLFKGTWNADIYSELLPCVEPQDQRFDKARMSGLWSPVLPFYQYLKDSGKKTLLFAGVNTDQCLLGTLTDAYSHGWDCILIEDCAGTMTEILGAKEVCDYNVATNMGFVTTSEEFCAANLVRAPLSRAQTCV
ncbi:hypothetical protein LTR62_005423 [Meristemomyces frigidus]|uniref:Isochorismatase-like domain-containing protein n=1 Tax=Meristemomyces frigidus TaxID=1508187 RepID=A0AAN7TDG2_9PEZI|nr:hypothetical protein LTR62_005423 [Meristemomyces frigidus]